MARDVIAYVFTQVCCCKKKHLRCYRRACCIELLRMVKEAETVIEINRAMAVYPNCCESNFFTVINSVITRNVKGVKCLSQWFIVAIAPLLNIMLLTIIACLSNYQQLETMSFL